MFTLGRKKNLAYRSREYLTPTEVKRLIEAAGERGRHRLRDRILLLMSFRHGLRAGEACLLRWDTVMFDARTINITRLKKSESGIHRLQEDEIQSLWQLQSQYQSHYVFANERGEHLSTGAIAKIVERSGEVAALPLSVHPHMLRHACGYYLAEQGLPTRDIQAYLGHRTFSIRCGIQQQTQPGTIASSGSDCKSGIACNRQHKGVMRQ